MTSLAPILNDLTVVRPLDAAGKTSRSERRDPRFSLRYEKVAALFFGGPPRRATGKPEPASRSRSCPRSVPPVANAPVVRMTQKREAVRDPSCRSRGSLRQDDRFGDHFVVM